jgi:uncharacterized protein YbbC (DUF1343 family)
MHHLRSGVEREWAEFPERAEGNELVLAFQAKPDDAARTLRLRHRDLKQPWRMLLNGKEIARLPFDEADMITYWEVPAGTLLAGTNELRIHANGRASDDVLIGEVALIDGSREHVLSRAAVDVSVHGEPGGHAIPSRITVVDEEGALVSLGNVSGPEHAVRPGVVYSRSGPVRLKLPAGRYVIHAGRGFEYSIASVAVDLAQGSNAPRRLTIRREVDTAGWAAMDTHVHTATFARHGDAAIDERMLTIAGEGLELPVSAEHNMRVDFDARAGETGVRKHFTPILGSEVTTPAIGHFNVFPLRADGNAIDQQSPDWSRLRESIGRAAREPIIVLNHGRDMHGGFRPLGAGRHISIAGEDAEGWSLPANAMEIVNSGAIMSDGLSLPRDWMGLLNRGVILTPIGSSDSHDVSRYIVGQGRTYVRCDDRDPGRIDVAQAMSAVRRGQVTVSYGLLTEVDVEGKGPGELVSPRDALDVRIRVKGPSWTRAQRIALYVNGVNVREEEISNGTGAGVKWQATWRLSRPTRDVHLVAVANGPGVAAPYWPSAKPYQPTSIAFTSYVLGVSGAVFVDADGSGKFESAVEYARREVAAANGGRSLVARLGTYDMAVATQAASLLRAQDAATFEARLRSMIHGAPSHVAKGLIAYLDAWTQSRTARGTQVPSPGPAAPTDQAPVTGPKTADSMATVRPGIEMFLADLPPALRGRRVGLITNHTGIDRARTSDIDLIAQHSELKLVALLAPEHGIRGDVAAGEKVVDEADPRTRVPIFSLYMAEDRGPTLEMLKDVDVLVYDLQEVGGRTWTYVSTMALAMQAAAKKKIPFVVLDRPNPIGGEIVEGALLDPKFRSFVGMYPIPARHGMTVGELARLFNQKYGIGVDLIVAQVANWRRSLWFDQTGLPWVNPSPNLRSLAALTSYPGSVYFEGTNLTEGRGTDRPFEQIGASWLNAPQVATVMNGMRLPGIRFEPVTLSVASTAAKFKGQTIPGIRFVITDRQEYRPVRTSLLLIDEIRRQHPHDFAWTATIDRLTGSDKVRLAIEGGGLGSLLEEWDREAAEFRESRKPFLLYP